MLKNFRENIGWWCCKITDYIKQKTPEIIRSFNCAQDRNRTCTSLRTPAPQAGVSTSFTTWAIGETKIYKIL